MNEILIKFEEMLTSELIMIFEYLVDLINYRKEQERLKKKRLKAKENLIAISEKTTNDKTQKTKMLNASSLNDAITELLLSFHTLSVKQT